MESPRLVIADDDPAIREILRTLIESLGARVVAEADNGRVAIQEVQRLHPDVLLLDVSMPVMGGFAAARFLRENEPQLPIIIVSQCSQKAYAEEAIDLGIKAYIAKGSLATELEPALEAVLSGRTFVSARMLNDASLSAPSNNPPLLR